MKLTTQNIVAWHDKNPTQHNDLLDEYADKDFRTISLSVYGTSQVPLFAAVMIKRPTLIATSQVGPVSQAGMQDAFDDMAKKKWGPYILTATGAADSPVFAGVFTPMSPIPLTRLNLAAKEFADLNVEQEAADNILIWADAFGTADDVRYTAIWGPNPSRQAWNCEAIDEEEAALQARFLALRETWCRPAHVAVTPAGRHLEVFVDSTMGPWSSRTRMTSAEFDDEFGKAVDNDLLPIRVSASGSGANARFAAIFAGRDDADGRVFRSNGPVSVPAIDAAMETYITDHNMRGAALAITLGTRLVYAKGYTYAEPAPIYPDVLPTTLFRQASVSKTFAAVALWRLIELTTGGALLLDASMQAILDLAQPNDTAPKDSRFGDIRLRYLLESTSGMPQGLLYSSVAAAEAFGASLPASQIQLARHGASFDLSDDPGSPTNVVYGNFDYFMLSQVIAKLAEASSFEEALNTLVLAPLSMTRTRGSRSLLDAQGADEARHHLHSPTKKNWTPFPLQVARSVKTDARPTVAYQYGAVDYEMFDGAGGLSSAVVDVARLAAMFSDRSGNPVLSTDNLDGLLNAAVDAKANLSGPDAHGYHGFDWAYVDDAADHVYRASKGGWLPGQGSTIRFTTGGLGFAEAHNGPGRPGVSTGYFDEVAAAAAAHTWPNEDLFPDFGMPSLTLAPIPPLAISSELTARLASEETPGSQVEASLARELTDDTNRAHKR